MPACSPGTREDEDRAEFKETTGFFDASAVCTVACHARELMDEAGMSRASLMGGTNRCVVVYNGQGAHVGATVFRDIPVVGEAGVACMEERTPTNHPLMLVILMLLPSSVALMSVGADAALLWLLR